MKKKLFAAAAGIVLCMAFYTGCGRTADKGQGDVPKAADEENQEAGWAVEEITVRIGSLKGPTSMGLVYLMSQSETGEAEGSYAFTMAAAADELLPRMVSGDLDIALVPANAASILYHKTEGGVSVIDINTLGVLYIVSGDASIRTMEDLRGRTVYLTGKGTTPDYVLQYLLTENGLTIDDITLEYKSEAAEVAAVLKEDPSSAGVLPQPFAMAACMQNEALSAVMDLTAEWSALQGEDGSRLVTGVTVVRNDFLTENPEAVRKFMEEHKASAAYANENTEAAAELVAAYGIVEKALAAAKAMPYCNITYIDGAGMRTALSGYLAVLYEKDAASIGGGLPADDFYYLPQE
ncbi:MAG: ABC transporter substrate-binding protein [Blautia sp.]|nr:ABC transporter substrate-binding protein [Blautia sp.]MCM1200742.1 ABC transporter substrate-binding protein [Bacteroides fragilis]